MLDNHVVQAALMLAGFIVPLTTTVLLTQPNRQTEQRGDQVAAATAPAAPDATTAEPKRIAPEPAPAAPSPPVAPHPDAAATNTEAPDEETPPVAPDPPELFAPAQPAGDDMQRFLALYDRAVQRADAGDEGGARLILKQVAVMDAPDAERLMCRAKAHAFLGDFARAIDDADLAIRQSSRDARTWHTRAMILAKADHLKAALSDIIVAVRLATRGDTPGFRCARPWAIECDPLRGRRPTAA